MANYCYNTIRVTGTKEAVGKIHNVLKECDKTSSLSVYDFLSAHGYTEKQLENVDRRDYINDFDPDISKSTEQDKFYFDMTTESAWGPNLTMFFVLAKQKYDGQIKLCYISEEQGNEIFQTNDLNGSIWADKYYIDYRLDDEEVMGSAYFSYKEELVDFVRENFNVECFVGDDLQSIANRIKHKYHVLNVSDYYCCIYEFEYDNNYYETEAEHYAGNRV